MTLLRSRDRYITGPQMIKYLPPWSNKEYLRTVGVGPVAFAALVAVASHEAATGESLVALSLVNHFLGVNAQPSIYRLIELEWLETSEHPVAERGPHIRHSALFAQVTRLGWEELEFVGVTNVQNHVRGNPEPEGR